MNTEVEYKRINLIRDGFERRYKTLIRALLNSQFRAVAKAITEGNYGEPPLSVINDDDMKKVFVSLYETVGGHFAAMTYRTQKAEGDEELVDHWAQYMRDYAATRVGARIVSINRLTREQIRKVIGGVIGTATEEGLGALETARRIRKALNTEGEMINTWRSLRIARTEVATASNAGSLLVAEEFQFPTDKVWIATMDQRTRDMHAAMNNVAVDVHEPFDVGGWPMQMPLDPDGLPEDVINCRCGMIYRQRR